MRAIIVRMVVAAEEQGSSVESIVHALRAAGWACAIFDVAIESSEAETIQEAAYEASAELQERLRGGA